MKNKKRRMAGSFIAMVCSAIALGAILLPDRNAEKSVEISSEEPWKNQPEEQPEEATGEPESSVIVESSEEAPESSVVVESSEEAPESSVIVESSEEAPESSVIVESSEEAPESSEASESEEVHACSFVMQEVLPTCLLEGKQEEVCQECGKVSGTQPLEPLGHDYVKSIWETATCMKGGYCNNVCRRCGVVEAITEEALPHEIEDIVVQEGNCMQDTIIRHICKNCQNQIGTDTRYTPQLHSWKSDVVDGETVTYCEWCGVMQ